VSKSSIEVLKKKFYIIYQKITGTYQDTVEIPESWKNPDYVAPIEEEKAPVAVEPTITFHTNKKYRSWPMFMKLKRLTAAILFVISIVSVVGYILSFSFAAALVYYVPVTVILFDYLVKTREEHKPKWYVLDDMEDKK